MSSLLLLNLRWILRDRAQRVLLALALLLMFAVPVFSSFSMRQPQELAITIALSFISFVLLVYAVFLGSTLLWRELERRYTFIALALPVSRRHFVVAKFLAVAGFLAATACVLGLCSVAAIQIGSLQYPSALPVQWERIALAVGMDLLKALLIAAIALLVTTISTSFVMPFFVTIALFFAGTASQDVHEYVHSQYGADFGVPARGLIDAVYYLLPNFNAFDYKIYAIYPIPLDGDAVQATVVYFVTYTALVVIGATLVFCRRELE